MSTINILIGSLWLISAVVDYSDFCYLWQLKEYRLDRLRDFLSTKEGQAYWRQYALLWRSLLAIVALLWPINNVIYLKYALIGIFLIDLARNALLVVNHRYRHPTLTAKAVIVITIAWLTELALFVLIRDWSFIFLLLMFRFFILSFSVFLLQLPTKLVKQWYVRKATKKILWYKNLTVIGVTGSYGKTSVKTFLAHILSAKFRVINTPKNVNTEVGIAKFILTQDLSEVDIFVAEMGAYKAGEIQLICDMVKPAIGILTAISDQHLALFGDIKKTQAAKYELLHSLPSNGLAVVNSDNLYCREYLSTLTAEVTTFGTLEGWQPTYLIKNVNAEPGRLHFVGQMRSEPARLLSAPILGAHNALNLAPCVLVARHLGLTPDEIQEKIKTLPTPEHTLNLIQYSQCTLIDDSYNANYDGFVAALKVFLIFPSDRRRLVITRGIPELGEKSALVHERLGKEIADAANELIIITKDFVEPLRQGAGDKPNFRIKIINKPEELLRYLRSLKEKKCIILLENRLPKLVSKELLPAVV